MDTKEVMKPIVSIIIPSFNREQFVAATLDSVLCQTRQDWECVVVDDGSTDRTKDIVREYSRQDQRIKLYDRDRGPKGACVCRNIGVSLCEGEYLIFLDTDDLLEPHCIDTRIAIMESDRSCEFAIFPSLLFSNEPNDLGLWWNIDKSTTEIIRQLYQDAICQGTGVIWRKSAFIKIGQWDEELQLWQDIDLFLRAFLNNLNYTKHFNVPPDLHIRRLESSLSRYDFFARAKQESRIVVIKKAAGLMKNLGKSEYLEELKYMVAEVTMGLVESNIMSLADEFTDWARSETILTRGEGFRLRIYRWCKRLRLSKMNTVRALLESLMGVFTLPESTLGKVEYQKGG
jgi:glycosyltransferase involved in cell wall biosynthesis